MGTPVVTGFAYGLREEVVVRLDGVRAFNLERQDDVPAGGLPSWTIAAIVTAFHLGRDAAYLIEFDLHGDQCLAVVREREIEGVA